MKDINNTSVDELQNIGDTFWEKNKLSKKQTELTDEDYNNILWLYKDSGVLLEAITYCKRIDGKQGRVFSTDIIELFGFEITDVFKNEKINSIVGNLYTYRSQSKEDKILKLYDKSPNILFEWDPKIYRWICKFGSDIPNDDLYLYIQSRPLYSYSLFDLY